MVLTETPDYSDRILNITVILVARAAHIGGNWGILPPTTARKGPLEYLFKERSIYSNRAVRI